MTQDFHVKAQSTAGSGTLSREQQLLQWITRHTPFHCQQLAMVSGDASFRRYFRFEHNGRSIIAVDAPPEHEDSARFVRIAKAYSDAGVPVPAVLAEDHELGFYLLEDFGDGQFADALTPVDMQGLYEKALALLPAVQSCEQVDGRGLPPFDQKLLDAEFHLFSHWLCEVHLALSLNAREKMMLQDTFAWLSEVFLAQPQAGVHRDYHSRNLMVKPDGSLGVIDFQDAVIGPITYDAVSLLRDCYQDWPEDDIRALLQRWHAEHFSEYEWETFATWFDCTGLQRHIKASGIFARLCHRDGKRAYLLDVPHTLEYIIRIGARYPQSQALAAFVSSRVKPAMLKTLQTEGL